MKKFFRNFEEIIGGSLFIVIFVVLIVQIFSRQVLDSPNTWSEQLARFLFVYVGYLAVSSEIKNEGHVRIEYFFDKLPEKVRVALHYFFQIIMGVILIVMGYIGYEMAMRKLPVEIVSLNISYFYMYMALPVLSVLMLYRLVEANIRRIKDGRGV
ncbi:TRAP transporter small permease protein [Salimicrobium jeotgali]|uniref:N-acetylneuraminate transporter large subunit n=1 Tax=Salimicrobium jeotgali TaxID=1230341 RepID=K2H682_9BACI|nr:TRAP transporter small permease [Salimicrobium jeotgali]AKG03807.1 TRAP transporter small permease protein [Salimicrobium jeotgali]EKE31300.1 N-acetylneuraminate transporter large subunit [Salimicrobium jeotgali]MBM7697112.1 TRAP-type C4-dicarboxylate transport system permease small subunit [Salimicrobium jeotgali]